MVQKNETTDIEENADTGDKNRFGASLRTKVILTMVFIIFVMTGATGYIWFYYWREQLIELTEDQVSMLFKSVEFSITRAMEEGRQEDVSGILKQIHMREEMLSLRIYDMDGVIKRSSHEEEEGTKPALLGPHVAIGDVGPSLTSLRSGKGGNLRLMYPIEKKELCANCHKGNDKYVGILELNLSLDNIQDIINKNRNWMIYYTIIMVLILSLAVVFLFEREVHAPISSIVETINEIEAGNLTARINLSSKDKLGMIAIHLNSMISKLENAIGEIREYHRKELKKSQRLAAIGELAASISHEIRNPLAGIKGAIQVIIRDENVTERHAAVLREVLSQVDRLNGTVGDLLTFSRPLTPEVSPTRISAVLDSTLDPLKLEPYLGDIELVRRYAESPETAVDHNLIEQAFFNIVINSLQAMEGNGTLTITLDQVEGNTLVTFEDTGCGISPDNMEKIFRPFYTSKHRGTGLGLSIARNIIEAHGGTVEVSSEEGCGTTFVISIPGTSTRSH